MGRLVGSLAVTLIAALVLFVIMVVFGARQIPRAIDRRWPFGGRP
jgi:Sec-independent protein translocase protein TatA